MNDLDPGQIYDSMPKEGQNMSRAEFCRRFTQATDPKKIQSDLTRIMTGRGEKRAIDNAIKSNRR